MGCGYPTFYEAVKAEKDRKANSSKLKGEGKF